jgi:2-oxoglutarate dehydrogenase E1 component
LAVSNSFGPNEWLVDEIYEQFLQDKNSVDPAWWEFFADYSPKASAAALSAPAPAPAPTTTAPTQVPAPAHVPAAARDLPPTHATVTAASVEPTVLKGPAARVVTNMEASLSVPTATSVRAVPAKLMIENRIMVNDHLARARGGKVSFTHLIAFAVVRALRDMPSMNATYGVVDDKPAVTQNTSINLGIAIDLTKADGTRQLLVPAIKNAEQMDFAQFWITYEDLVRRARGNKLTADDFTGTTVSLTNPGGLGTVHSVPRLMSGQAAIIGVGALEYPAEFQGASEASLIERAIGKVTTLTSTYDHRVIQGAQSGEFLRRIHQYLTGEDGFYDEIFASLRVPYTPLRWATDIATTRDRDIAKATRVHALIRAYRSRGHLLADVDPLEYHQRGATELDIETHGLTIWDLDREFTVGGFNGRSFMKLRDIISVLRSAYCRTISVEYMYMNDQDRREWFQERLEGGNDKIDRSEQLRILHKLNEAEAFENFLHTKFVGQKRFSLEGGESVIPLLDAILDSACVEDLDEVCIGMPHRGRLNVLANIAGKSYAQIFREFEGHYGEESVQGSGDVKYHLGTKGVYTGHSGDQTNVYLAANPSHLETVDPVLEGIVRAKLDIDGTEGKFNVLPILLHGDAAFAGQGVVYETMQMSQLQGYRVGGTIHVVINNQIGFTTSPQYSRTSTYCTDVARVTQSPVFHVNGDDPEAVVRVARLAFEFRQRFKSDVVIDMVCYRRRGHNEADDPSLTQPLMYDLVDQKRSVRKLYTEQLVGRGDITVEEAEAALKHFQSYMESILGETRAEEYTEDHLSQITATIMREGEVKLHPQAPAIDVPTGISMETVQRVVHSQLEMPEGFTVHPRLAPQLARRAEMIERDEIDWGMGEALAFGSLLTEGTTVRLAGQDARRGTFGHRHAVIVDKQNGRWYKPLKRCYENDSRLYVYDSLLSEYAAMGFEYGYSVARPDALTLWEGQFGDFANGAQTVIDEYISSGEQKWGQKSSVVLLLPHGYEGQGPDHSSARVERYLQLCAQDNMTVAMPSTPASYFHLLRWQVHGPRTRPLVIFTPKSLLRAKAATSRTADFTSGSFRAVLGDDRVNPADVKKVLLCAGKVYYDLAAERERRGAWDTAIVRIERFYPVAQALLPEALAPFPKAELRWVQEEPANQGAWAFLADVYAEILDKPLRRVSRPTSSSPAVGSHHRHEVEQAALIEAAFA